jgi:DNA-binding MarR family transcriptional regulator
MQLKSKESLIQNILVQADKLFRQLLPTVPKELLTLDVSLSQLKIMLLLFIHGPMRMSIIAAALEVTLPTTTSLMDRLAEKNYILRENQTSDRRVVVCQISEKGQNAIESIWESGRTRSRELLEKMDENKLEMFVEVLESMMKSAERGKI